MWLVVSTFLKVTAQPVGSPDIGVGRLATVTTNGTGFSVPPNCDKPPPPVATSPAWQETDAVKIPPAATPSPVEPLLLVRTVTFVAPGAPGGPAGPCGPGSPFGPAGPCGPGGPGSPFGPCGPVWLHEIAVSLGRQWSVAGSISRNWPFCDL